ncbi:MAG: RNA polymerase sigma factor [Sphingobium sp.]
MTDQMPPDGLSALFLENRDKLQRFLRARTGSADDSEDILQDLWIKVQKAQTGPVSDGMAYLYRMAHNAVLDSHRSDQRRKKRDDAWQAGRDAGAASTGISAEPDPEALLMQREKLSAVEAALNQMPERTAYLFRAFRVEGKSQKLLAQELGISISAVEKHLQRAYRAIMALEVYADNGDRRRLMTKGDEDA